MTTLAFVFISLTALLHLLFFKLESLDFTKAKVLKLFGLSPAEGAVVKTWALNQGFYNLFLALGLFYSLFLLRYPHTQPQFGEGKLLAQFILLSLVGAGGVLGFSSPDKIKAALIQALPALAGYLFTFFI